MIFVDSDVRVPRLRIDLSSFFRSFFVGRIPICSEENDYT